MRRLIPILLLFAGIAVAHEGEEESSQPQQELDPDARAIAATLEAFAASYEATDIDAIRRLTSVSSGFSHIEGTFADWTWKSYAGHLAEEMPAFSETRYQLSGVRPEAHGGMGFATFDWALDVVILSDQFPDGRHPVQMQGVGTAVLVKEAGEWKLRHLHTARATPAPAGTAD